MENNHSDVGQKGSRERPVFPKPETQPRAEKPKRQERVSITEWMAQTLDEMKRRVGWVKENPEAKRAKQMTREYPDLNAQVEQNLTRVERRASEALDEARQELERVVEGSTPIEELKPKRFLKPVSVDMNDRDTWHDFKIQLIQEFDQTFHELAPRKEDFAVKLSAPLSTTTLDDLRKSGPQPVRVRSESVGGVRVDALIIPPDSNKVGEYRVYGLDGQFRTVPGNQDPVEVLIEQARTNQNTFQNWIKERQKRDENQRILNRRESFPSQTFGTSTELDLLVQKHEATLGTAEEYTQTPEKILKLTGKVRMEPAVTLEDRRVEENPFTKNMEAKYGKEVGQALREGMFTDQDFFDQYYKAWELATHNTTLKPDELALIQKTFGAMKTEGKERGLTGKKSYAYLVEAYKTQENDLPKILENIQSVKEIVTDPLTEKQDLQAYQKELNYLNHLKTRLETSTKRTLHQQIEKFLEQNQHLLTLGEIREILEADQALDNATDYETVRVRVAEAMDFPSRLVLDKKLNEFTTDYSRFMTPLEKTNFEKRVQKIKTQPGPIQYGAKEAEIGEAMNTVKRRAWNNVAVESLTRLNQAIAHYEETMDYEAFPVVSRLRMELQQAVPRRAKESINLFAMEDILKRFSPIEFERYLTSLLSAATGGKDMRPNREKPEGELRPLTTAPGTTWVEEPKATPVEVQMVEEEPKGTTWVEEPMTAAPVEVTEEHGTLVPEQPTPVQVEALEEDEEYEDVSAEIPDLVRTLRSVHGSSEDARPTTNRAREILEKAGSEEIIEVTQPILKTLDTLRSKNKINDRIYRRALATLIAADSFNQRERAVENLQAELPIPGFMHQPGELRIPGQEIHQENEEKKKGAA